MTRLQCCCECLWIRWCRSFVPIRVDRWGIYSVTFHVKLPHATPRLALSEGLQDASGNKWYFQYFERARQKLRHLLTENITSQTLFGAVHHREANTFRRVVADRTRLISKVGCIIEETLLLITLRKNLARSVWVKETTLKYTWNDIDTFVNVFDRVIGKTVWIKLLNENMGV